MFGVKMFLCFKKHQDKRMGMMVKATLPPALVPRSLRSPPRKLHCYEFSITVQGELLKRAPTAEVRLYVPAHRCVSVSVCEMRRT